MDTGSKVTQGSVLQRQSWPQPLGKGRSGGGATSSVPRWDNAGTGLQRQCCPGDSGGTT